ncbi:unnamed protein product [Alopecurus aequalis]
MDHEASTSHDILERMLLDESAEPTSLPLSLLQYITNRFSLDNQIGSGGFAVVYKGMVGKGIVAVKKLSNTLGLHENKFHEEVKCLIKAKHSNIVRFLGYCAETQGKMEKYEGKLVMADRRNWLLCFEYVCNGSLDKHITDATCGLNWRERYRIIRGICEGLLFLHEMRILHLDLKPANILLDHHMVPKIADFGLSRCLGEDQTRAITENLHGTLGYMDPEYLRSGQIAFASDIYSLGVIIMEILTGAKRYLEDDYVVEIWMNRLDASKGGLQLEQVRVCCKIGIECMNLDPKKRPVVQHIIDMLDKTASADYTEETYIQGQVSLPRQQFGERTGKLEAESLQKLDAEERSEILEDVAERLGWLHPQEGQLKVGQLPLLRVKYMKEKLNCHGTTNSNSICTGFSKKSIVDIFNQKAHMNFDRNDWRTLEKSHFINIFRKEELRPILRSSNFIGKDLFAEVYKGIVDNALVVVKKTLNGNVLENTQLENEVTILSQIIHKNIVWLIGFCLEMDTPILVYEFLPKGSLDDILHNSSQVPLHLDARLNIVAESAHGLAYLHSQARSRILHGDIKPANILLDDNFIPKISNFGLPRLIARDKKHTCSFSSDIAYMDPVYQQTGLLTEKSDVYSFGVVILEIISRKKATHSDNNSLVKSFLEVHVKVKTATELFDNEIAVTRNLELLGCLAEIAVECLNPDVDQRPSMTEVADRLVILSRSRRLHAQCIRADYIDGTDTISSFVKQKKEIQLRGVQDTNRPSASLSSSMSTGFYKMNNLDIFNRKERMLFFRNNMRILEKSHFVKIFRKEQVMSVLKVNNSIGKGLFSEVYKGVVDNALVMLKKPINCLIAMVENGRLKNEAIIQSQVVHKNIHRLIGCCLEMDTPVLVYEFVSRGSLDDILHRGSKVPLNLDVRLRMVAESAQGLAYLHSHAHCKILHGDVRPASILLDDNFIPKITNFGLSWLITLDKQHNARFKGDMTYTDPVYLQTGLLNEKSDVYSFGIVILEVISRKKSTRSKATDLFGEEIPVTTGDNMLVNSFLEVYKKGKKTTELFDKELAVTTRNLEILDYMAKISVECLTLDLDQRPTMTDVAERLLILHRYHRSQVVQQ